jgi:hypothetical protein
VIRTASPLRITAPGETNECSAAPKELALEGALHGVEIAEGFVQQKDVRDLHLRASQAGQAALTTGQLTRPAGQQPGEPQLPGPSAGPLLHFCFRPSLHPQSDPRLRDTSRNGINPDVWKTMATRRSADRSPVTGRPLIRTSPESIESRPASTRSRSM